jgi:hypothetical protein
MWESGEMITLATADRYQVSEQLRVTKKPPDLSHFEVIQGQFDISQLHIWPAWRIELSALLFPITFRVDGPIWEWKDCQLENVTRESSVKQAWQFLCVQHQEIYQYVTFNFTGRVHPGLLVEAEIKRKKVIETLSFQVINIREIRSEHHEIWNVWTTEEVWEHFFTNDSRILPFECYDVEDMRPLHPHTSSNFVLRDSDVVDTAENQGGSAGEDNRSGWTWPPV